MTICNNYVTDSHKNHITESLTVNSHLTVIKIHLTVIKIHLKVISLSPIHLTVMKITNSHFLYI
jgi:hypothetical protein